MRSYKANFTALLIAETLAIIGFALSSPVIPLFLEEDMGITDPLRLKIWVGLIQSSASVTMAFFAPIWGHMADTYNRRAMLLRAMFGGAIMIPLFAIVNSPWQLLVLKSIQGALTGTVAAATVLTAGITPAAQVAFALGLLQTGIAVGNSLGPMMGGIISDFLGHKAAFLSTGVVMALSGFIVLKWVDDYKKPASEKKPKESKLFPDIRPIIGSPLLVTLLLVSFSVQAANTAAAPMLPLFLKSLVSDVSQAPAYIGSSTGIVLGVGAGFTALAAVLSGKFSSRLGYWKTLFFCLAGGAAVTIPQTFVTDMYQLTILRAMSSFFIGATAPVINAIIAISSEKEHQGTIYGFNTSVSSTGAAVGPMIGSAAAIISYRAVFLASALILVLSARGTYRRQKKINAA